MSSPGQKTPLPQYRFRFGTAEFDESRLELRVSGVPIDVQRKPLEILAVLLARPGEVVTKEELRETVWHARPTVEHVIASAIGKLRGALGEQNAARIVTLPRIGYRFDGPFERMAVGRATASRLQLAAGQAVPGRPSFVLESLAGGTAGSEVWLARHAKTRAPRIFKFSADGGQLAALKREATLSRLLRENLGERPDFVRVLDWNFEAPPFFLEVEHGGTDLARWAADGDRLESRSLPQRLALFLQIADAVAAAHSIGVLHKDLKPANVLVAPGGPAESGGWQLRLTDFGSSRLLEPERLADLGITRLGLTVSVDAAGESTGGTPLYLAPELIAGRPPTVASDVYALGVMLFQVVVGDLRRPLVPGWERGVTDPLLREDIARATDGDPALRLASVGELSVRLSSLPERHREAAHQMAREHEAGRAREALQRARARRPWAVAASVMLAVGATSSSILWWDSERQRRLAQQQLARSEAVVRFIDRALGAISSANSGRGNDTTVREMLEYASARGRDDLPGDPEVRGDVHTLLGRSWRYLGDSARGVEEYRAAVSSYVEAFGDSHDRTLLTRYALVRTLTYMQTSQSFVEAEAVLDDADRLAGARLKQHSPLALQAAVERGIFHLRRLQMEPALQALRRADDLQRQVAPEDAGIAALIRGNLADALQQSGRPEDALAWLQTLEADPLMARGRIGEVSAALLQAARANALHDVGRHTEALALAQAAADTFRTYLGPDNYLTLTQLSSVAGIQRFLHDCAAALPLARDVRERMAKTFGNTMQATLIATGQLGLAEHRCGDAGAGLGYLRQAESELRLHFGEDNEAAKRFGLRLLAANGGA
jgi:non-specific serine/threonine protein kinase